MKIILSGSGVRYPVHVGALKRLVETGKPIEAIAGVSGGAIVATAFASGFDWKHNDLEKLVLGTLPGENDLIDTRFWVIGKPYGRIKGRKFLKKFKTLFNRKFGSMLIPLHLVTVDLPANKHLIWNESNSPDADVALIVRASISIPVVFDYVPIPAKWHTETAHLTGTIPHVDGGVANNFPIDMFGDGKDVVGIKLVSTNETQRTKIDGFKSYVGAVIDTMVTATENEHIDSAIFARVLRVPTSISGLDFNITKKQAKMMIKEGYDYVDQAIKSGRLDI